MASLSLGFGVASGIGPDCCLEVSSPKCTTPKVSVCSGVMTRRTSFTIVGRAVNEHLFSYNARVCVCGEILMRVPEPVDRVCWLIRSVISYSVVKI